MAGAFHSVKTFQPFLDYSIVPITKYVDNRVQEKIEKNILNITKTFETLHSLTSRYQNAPNLLDFAENKKTTYVSDIYLSQDRQRRVFGTFVVDKAQVMKKETAFPFILGNAKQALNDSEYQQFQTYLASRLRLNALKVFEGNEELGSIDGDAVEINSYYDFKEDGTPSLEPSNVKLNLQRDFFEAKNPSGDNSGLEYFSFKHNIKSPTDEEKTYHVEVEYVDPTVDLIKLLKQSVMDAVDQVTLLINFVNKNPVQKTNEMKRSGFDQATEKISDTIIEFLKTQGEEFGINLLQNGVLRSVRNMIEDQRQILLIYFYSPDVRGQAIANFLLNLSNVNTTTVSQLLVLQQFLEHLNNKLGSDLDSFGSKPIKSTRPLAQGTVKAKGNVRFNRSDRKIMFKGGKNKIRTYDYGYDFTGFIDSPNEQDLFTGREQSGYLKIMSNDYQNACLLAFSEIKRGSLSLQDALATQFKPYGLTTRTVSDLVYSYLNIPINNVTDSVVLPATIIDGFSGNVQVTPAFNALNILTSISKIKKYIAENNFVSIDGTNNAGLVLKEDLISILAQDGVDLPSVGQTEFGRVGLVLGAITQPLGSFNQSNVVDAPVSDLVNSITDINPGLSAVDQKFKASPKFTNQTNINNNNDVTKNNLMNSLYARKNFSKAKNRPFKLKTSDPNFKPYDGSGILEKSGLKPPLQALCLSVAEGSPFKDYLSGENKFYISNGVVNPAALAYFWFKHQNIVRIEYLSGYRDVLNTVRLKNKENPYEPGQRRVTFERDVKKPIWRPLKGSTIASLPSSSRILCRLVRYNYSFYINKALTKTFDIPMINDHFILEKSETSFVVPEPPGVELAAGQVLDQISDILQDAKDIPGIPDVDALIKKIGPTDVEPPTKKLQKLFTGQGIAAPLTPTSMPGQDSVAGVPAAEGSNDKGVSSTPTTGQGGSGLDAPVAPRKQITKQDVKSSAQITTAISDFFNTGPRKTR